MYDKFFEEYEIGERWTSRGRTITETDLVMFSSLTGDFFPLHTDCEYSKNTFFKQRIAHGMLVLSYAVGLTTLHPDIIVANYGIDQLRFIHPVFINDTIHVELEVIELQAKDNGTGVVTARQTIVKQTGEKCVVGITKALVNKKQ